MLVVFCGALMVAFLIPQAVSQFAPNPATQVRATTYGDQPITQEDIVRISADLQTLRRLRIEPPEFASFGMTLLPATGSERDDALSWIMIQRAAEHNNLGASQQEAFNLVASVLGLQDFDSLDERAKDFGASAGYLIELGRQYLVAEQYRQLVSGIEYNLPEGEDELGSPGLRRVIAMNEAIQAIQQALQQFGPMAQQNPQMMQQLIPMATQNVLVDQGYLDKIQGHERFSATELRYALQQQFSEIDLTVVVLDAEDRLDTTVIDDAYIKGIFERFADDQPGTGEPYGLGYREPNKVQLEALRIPIDKVREVVAKTITPEDVRKFYNENRSQFTDDTPPAEGEEATPGPAKLTMELRDEIRLTLTQMRAEQKVVEIAQRTRQRLNEDARGLPDDGVFKALPDDFVPTPLTVIAAEIEAEHGVMPEIIQVDEFVSAEDIVKATQFTQAWLTQMPTSTVQMPDASGFGFLVDRQVPETVLGGKAGLFASFVPDLSDAQRGQLARLADYISIAQPFLTDEQREQTSLALQVGLPGIYVSDMTRSTYVFRITKAQPARPATDMTPIAEQVREDALKVKAYEDLAEEKEALVKRAVAQTIESLMADADAKKTLTGLTRQSVNQRFGASIEGVSSSQPILQQAFQITDDLIASGGFEQADESAKHFAVELAGDYKLALVRIDTFRPMTRFAFEEQAKRPASLMLATSLGANAPLDPPLSFEALKRYTGFKWAEGFGDEEEDEEGAEAEGEEAVTEEEAE
jgi:hypothetical protein